MAGAIRVLIVDDHLLFRRGIKALLSAHQDIQLVGEAGDYWRAMQFLRCSSCDIVVLDLSMPGRDGLDLIASIKASFQALPILVLTMHAEEEYATRAIRSGANGFVTKDTSEEELADAIRRVARGQTAISHKVAEVVAVQLSRQADSSTSLAALSGREFRIYEMLARGMRVSSIAASLNLSVKTVSTYKIRLLKKLGLESQCDVVRHHLRNADAQRGDPRAASIEEG